MPEAAWAAPLLAAAIGLAVSVPIERLMTPRPLLARPGRAWCLHGGVWLLTFCPFVLLLGRPWFAAVIVSALLMTVVQVNNAKVKALQEAFVFQDYEYFTDAILHPRLYLPFLGWAKFIGAAVGFCLALYVGLWGESAPAHRFAPSGQLGAIAAVAALGLALLFAGTRRTLPVSFDPNSDVPALGLLASGWRYAMEERRRPAAASPFDALAPTTDAAALPHLVAIQSESFFDPRLQFPGIRADVLANFDRMKGESLRHGKLKVPAWGANTVRTEFAFLSGLDEPALGVHRFNPYRALAGGWDVGSLARTLKRLGYRTVCVHPYPASFYRRKRVYPGLGFDEFVDIAAFDGAQRAGPYVGDVAVADKIAQILDQASVPTFVFAITMENHGPLHLEQVEPADLAHLHTAPPATGCEDLTIYLRHLRNADRMVGALRDKLEQGDRPTGLCWYGDHVPIMPTVYQQFGTPAGETEFLIWSSADRGNTGPDRSSAHDLGAAWLRAMNVVQS